MEYLILGLLMLSPMTGYELRQFIRQNLSLICSDSAGSLQTALSKLGREGFVTAEESGGGRRKKTYSITEAGRAALRLGGAADAGGAGEEHGALAAVFPWPCRARMSGLRR